MSGQIVRRLVIVAAVLVGLAIGYVWATQGSVFELPATVAAGVPPLHT